MVSESVEFKGHLPIHASSPKSAAERDHRFTHQSPKSAWRDGGVLGKTHVPHRIDKTLDKSLYRGGNPHLMNRFCKDELDPQIHLLLDQIQTDQIESIDQCVRSVNAWNPYSCYCRFLYVLFNLLAIK